MKLVGCILRIAKQLLRALSCTYTASRFYRMHFYFVDLAIWSSFAFAYVIFRVHLCVDLILALHNASRHAMCFTEWLLEYVLAT